MLPLLKGPVQGLISEDRRRKIHHKVGFVPLGSLLGVKCYTDVRQLLTAQEEKEKPWPVNCHGALNGMAVCRVQLSMDFPPNAATTA